MQTRGEKARNKLELLKSQGTAHGTNKTGQGSPGRANSTKPWSILETVYPKSTGFRLLDFKEGHVMHILPSNKQVFNEKLLLLSNPLVPSVQKNEKNENKIAITRNKNKQTEIKVSWGKVESTYDSEELIFPF